MKRQFIWVAGGRVLAAVLQAAILVLLARSTDPATFGFFSAVFGIGVVLQNAFDLGLGTYVVRERATEPHSGKIPTALRINNATSIAMGTFAIFVLCCLSVATPLTLWVFIPLAVAMAAERNADVRLGVALADGDARVNTLNLVGRRTGTILVFFVLIIPANAEPVLAYCLAAALAGLVSVAAAHGYVRRHIDPFVPRAGWHETLTASWPFYVNSFATQFRNLDTTLVAAFAGPAQGGLYAAAARLTGPLRILPTSLAAVLLPNATRANEVSVRRRSLALTLYVVLVMTLIYGVLALIVPWGIPVVLGRSYSASIPALQIVLVGLVFAAGSSLLSASLQGWGDAPYVGMVAATTSALCLVSVSIGAAVGGAKMAGAGLALSFLVQAIGLSVRLPRHLRTTKNP